MLDRSLHPPSSYHSHLPCPPPKMLTVLSVPHSASSGASSDASQPWNKVRAWFSRERGRAGRILQLALIGAARAASTSTNVVTPTPHRPATFENAVWDSRPGMESRLRDTQLTMFDWINIRQSDEYRKMVDGALPPLPSETEVGNRTHAVKVCWGLPCKPLDTMLTIFPPEKACAIIRELPR
jgi:hypothetical protein